MSYMWLNVESEIHGEVCMITEPPSIKRHKLANVGFIYMKISGSTAEGMPSLHV